MNNYVYFSGNDQQTFTGVATIISAKLQRSVQEFQPINDRIMLLKFNAKPHMLNFIQIYAPTSNSSQEDIEQFYTVLRTTLQTIPKKEFTIICGDFNAKIGKTTLDSHIKTTVGKYGIGKRNERGEQLLEFAIENDLTIMNTVFCHHIRRLYTWTSPDKKTRNQIDFILTNSRWRSSFQTTRTYPGALCGSDHKLLAARIRIRLKTTVKPLQPQRLTINNVIEFQKTLKEKLPAFSDNPPPQQMWNKIKQCMYDASQEQHTPKKQKHKHWISENTLGKIEERRMLARKGLHTDEERETFRNKNREIERACVKDKNDFYANLCQEIEAHAKTNQPRDLFKKIKYLTKEFKSKCWAIEDHCGQIRTDINEITETWKRYCENLYKDPDNSPQYVPIFDPNNEEPDILRSEVEASLKKLKQHKAPGLDQITAEVLQAAGDVGVDMFHQLCNRIWHTRQWPEDWTRCSITAIHKKGSTTKCDNYRTITLISHASKVLLNIINERLKAYISPQIPVEQAGFVKGRGTREQILNVRQIIEKSREFNNPLYLCFIDYQKAFDKVKWSQLWRVMDEMGVPPHLTSLVINLYGNTKSCVRVDAAYSEDFQPQCGVRQGCILSPQLFNLYGEYIMRRALENREEGIPVNGHKINNLRFADDTVLLAGSETEILQLIEAIESESRKLGLELNTTKTKIMIVDRLNNNRPDLTQIGRFEIVEQYIYLGSLINNTGTSEGEIRRRCEMTKVAMRKLTRIWKDRHISVQLKKRLVRCLVFPILMYGCESWTVRQTDKRKIDATEMYCWRRMLRIPWTARRTNISILEELKIQQRMSTVVQNRLLGYFGHIMRRDGDCIEKLIIQGKVPGKRPRGRSPSRWVDQITHITHKSFHELVDQAQDREYWKQMIYDTH